MQSTLLDRSPEDALVTYPPHERPRCPRCANLGGAVDKDEESTARICRRAVEAVEGQLVLLQGDPTSHRHQFICQVEKEVDVEALKTTLQDFACAKHLNLEVIVKKGCYSVLFPYAEFDARILRHDRQFNFNKRLRLCIYVDHGRIRSLLDDDR